MQIFRPSTETINRRKKRKEFKAAAKISYNMPAFYASDFSQKRELDINVIAFNNAKLIEYQIDFARQFLAPDYTHIVIDNSNKREESEKLRALCVAKNVTYAKVFRPKKIRGLYSASHAMALNWTYENFIKKRARNFGTIDHDLIPISKFDAAEYVRTRSLYGPTRKSPSWLYFLWAGFAFFNWEFVAGKNLDFGRLSNFWGKHIADSGSANWNVIYKNYDLAKIPNVKYELFDLYKNAFAERAQYSYEDTLDSCVEYLDDRKWLHLNGASGWHEIGNKNELAENILNAKAKEFHFNAKQS